MVLLKAEHITKKYSGRTIIKDINIELHKGELISLLGVSGSGKTTLFHVLSGLTTPEEGRVLLNGEDITSRPGQISYMLQKDLLFPHKKIIDNTALPLVLHGMSKTKQEKKHRCISKTLDLKEQSINILPSCPEVCAREQPCLEHIFLLMELHFLMNHLVHWIPLRKQQFTDGILKLCSILIYLQFL